MSLYRSALCWVRTYPLWPGVTGNLPSKNLPSKNIPMNFDPEGEIPGNIATLEGRWGGGGG